MKRALSLVAIVSVMVSLSWAQAPQRGGAGAAPPRGGAPGGGAAPAGGGGGGGARGGRAARISSFEAKPTSIKAGESIILSWATDNGSTSIDNGIGNVAPNGSIRITPTATTTYTLKIGALTQAVTVTVSGAVAGAVANTAANPRTIDGKPDFTGVYGGWNTNGPAGSQMGLPRATAVPAGVVTPFGNLPTQPTIKPGVANRGAGGANPAGGTADCMPLPADTAFGVPYPFQIIQSKDYFVFFFEYPGTFRIVPLNGAPHSADPDPSWMGESVGHWEGQTLVIDTVGYNGKHSIGGIQQPSEKFHTIERLSRTGTTGVFYEIIYEDPEFATGQWHNMYSPILDTRPGVDRIYEFVCENNRDYTPLWGPAGPTAGGRGAGGGAPGGGGGAPRGAAGGN